MALFINGIDVLAGDMVLLPPINKGDKVELSVKLTSGPGLVAGPLVHFDFKAKLNGVVVDLDPNSMGFPADPTEETIKSVDPLNEEGELVIEVWNPSTISSTILIVTLKAQVKEVAAPAPTPADADEATSEPAPKQGLSDFAKGLLIWAAALVTLAFIPVGAFTVVGLAGAGRMIGETFDASIENIFVEGDEVHIDNAGKTKVLPTEKAEEPAI